MKQVDKLMIELEQKALTATLKWLPIDEVKEKAKNPRKISQKDFNDLKKSIKDFPEMLLIRPGVIDELGELIGGTMRKRACKALGWPKFPVIEAKALSPEQLREFVIKDNLGAGDWDKELLEQDWDKELLKEWGMEASIFNEFTGNKTPMAAENHTQKKVLRFDLPPDVYESAIKLLETYHEDKNKALEMLVSDKTGEG